VTCLRESCQLPTAKRKHAHRLYICECGKAWIAVSDNNYAGNGWKWTEWRRA